MEKCEQYFNDAAPHMQARYCHHSLGTKIKVERIGSFEYLDQKITRHDLRKINWHAEQVIGSADLVVYMAKGKRSKGGGKAWVGSVCNEEDDKKYSISEWRSDPIAFANVSNTYITYLL